MKLILDSIKSSGPRHVVYGTEVQANFGTERGGQGMMPNHPLALG